MILYLSTVALVCVHMISGQMTNIFNMQTFLSTFWEPVITGLLVLIVVMSQRIVTIREERSRRVTEGV